MASPVSNRVLTSKEISYELERHLVDSYKNVSYPRGGSTLLDRISIFVNTDEWNGSFSSSFCVVPEEDATNQRFIRIGVYLDGKVIESFADVSFFRVVSLLVNQMIYSFDSDRDSTKSLSAEWSEFCKRVSKVTKLDRFSRCSYHTRFSTEVSRAVEVSFFNTLSLDWSSQIHQGTVSMRSRLEAILLKNPGLHIPSFGASPIPPAPVAPPPPPPPPPPSLSPLAERMESVLKSNPKLQPELFKFRVSKKTGYIEPFWFALLEDMAMAGRHIQLKGPPSACKTRSVIELAARHGKTLVDLNCDGRFSRADLTGERNIKDGTSFFTNSDFANAVIEGHWACLNEINFADPRAITSLNGIVEEPRVIVLDGKSYPVHKDFRLFLTYNPGLVGTNTLPDSLDDRFFPIVCPHPSVDQTSLILKSFGIPVELCVALANFAETLWGLNQSRALTYEVTLRRLRDAGLMMSKGYSFRESVHYSICSMPRKTSDRDLIIKTLEAAITPVVPKS